MGWRSSGGTRATRWSSSGRRAETSRGRTPCGWPCRRPRSGGDRLGARPGQIPVIDATNLIGGTRPEGFDSLAQYVKSLTGGPVAKAFSANFAKLYDRLGESKATPSMVYAADDEARAVTEQLIRDAGYEPVYTGGLESARAIEDFLGVLFAQMQSAGAPVLVSIRKAGNALSSTQDMSKAAQGRLRQVWD